MIRRCNTFSAKRSIFGSGIYWSRSIEYQHPWSESFPLLVLGLVLGLNLVVCLSIGLGHGIKNDTTM